MVKICEEIMPIENLLLESRETLQHQGALRILSPTQTA
jgi:hypothetical protein